MRRLPRRGQQVGRSDHRGHRPDRRAQQREPQRAVGQPEVGLHVGDVRGPRREQQPVHDEHNGHRDPRPARTDGGAASRRRVGPRRCQTRCTSTPAACSAATAASGVAVSVTTTSTADSSHTTAIAARPNLAPSAASTLRRGRGEQGLLHRGVAEIMGHHVTVGGHPAAAQHDGVEPQRGRCWPAPAARPSPAPRAGPHRRASPAAPTARPPAPSRRAATAASPSTADRSAPAPSRRPSYRCPGQPPRRHAISSATAAAMRCLASTASISRIANGSSSPRISRFTAPPRTRRATPARPAGRDPAESSSPRCRTQRPRRRRRRGHRAATPRPVD